MFNIRGLETALSTFYVFEDVSGESPFCEDLKISRQISTSPFSEDWAPGPKKEERSTGPEGAQGEARRRKESVWAAASAFDRQLYRLRLVQASYYCVPSRLFDSDGLLALQDGSKMAQKSPKRGSREPQDGSTSTHERSKRAQEANRRAQEGQG